ncbi:glycerophosphoryl diester phosphodiesterase [Kineococcus xinjiangensis]|uniref:Glycerophosphoryl diester phosphodiesterase n=1 Tax=Kineococcus xinjiangensis TaxID=512762 RepID=A0A2S6IIT5_9ACTN|nr:glycerophosphodiester phosphodiesterase family protein [Kineococcus xinjiangensis]PPK94108.1 glycerophosphoryl diester phosphodiesterase [Kineococcus xinjiangensis]
MRFADLPAGFLIAHRGGALQAPENTLEAYRWALRQGLQVLEQDVQVLADGALGVMHDGTVDRTTTSTGNVCDHTAASWKRLRIDAGTYLGGNWGDDLRPPLFEEVLAEFGGRALLCPEAKSPGTMAPMLDALESSGVDRETVLVQSFSRPECRVAVERGWQTLWLGSTDPAAAAADGISWIGVEAQAVTSSLCRSAHTLGVKVACYTVNRLWRWRNLKPCGVDACFSDDPVYLRDGARRHRRDAFAGGDWMPGMQPDGGVRGRFHSDGSFGFDAEGSAAWVLLGSLGPADPSAFTLDVAMCVDGLGEDAAGSLVLSTTDLPFDGSVSGGEGYEFLLHRDGRLVIRRFGDGVGAPVAEAGSTAVVAGDWVPLRVTVAAAGVSLARTDAPGAASAPAAAGPELGFLHIGRRGGAVRFQEVVFT